MRILSLEDIQKITRERKLNILLKSPQFLFKSSLSEERLDMGRRMIYNVNNEFANLKNKSLDGNKQQH